jgi:hypothetical protein
LFKREKSRTRSSLEAYPRKLDKRSSKLDATVPTLNAS